jgi:beta-1,4-mannosyltransferase
VPGVLAPIPTPHPYTIPSPPPVGSVPRVLSLPDDHPFVRHSTTPAPGPAGTPRRPLRIVGDGTHPWDPPAAFDDGWPTVHGRRFDLVHLHFGFETVDPGRLARWVTELRAAGKPLVFTAHDLRSPHQRDRRLLDDQLDVLVPGADAVVTLTAGAAAAIERRWGRRATVLAHPHIAPLPEPQAPATAASPPVGTSAPVATSREPGLVGVHLKGLRANVVDPVGLVEQVAAATAAAGGRLAVDLHLPGTAGHHRVAAALARAARSGGFEVRIHPRFDDPALFRYLSSLHVSVLPYRFGTHSGWLEACRDLGTAVVAPDVGHYREQWADVRTYAVDEGTGPDPDALAAAVAAALHAPPPNPADPAWRRGQRDALAAAHLALYRRLLGAG